MEQSSVLFSVWSMVCLLAMCPEAQELNGLDPTGTNVCSHTRRVTQYVMLEPLIELPLPLDRTEDLLNSERDSPDYHDYQEPQDMRVRPSTRIGIQTTTILVHACCAGWTRNGTSCEIHDALDDVIRDAARDNPSWGEKLMAGYLSSVRITVSRRRVRNSMMRVDPEGVQRRKRVLLKRRVYSVPGANALWHIDGNHKMIRWRFVIHGGIDGFSRLIPFLNCANNNRGSTVLESFKKGVARYGLPQKVRSDKGMENAQVAEFVLQQRGTNCSAFLTGRSVHNQRIERLWRDMNVSCISKFIEMFRDMEEERLLDPDCDRDIFCTHHIFLPIINKSLEEFRTTWNHHKIRTERNRNPTQIWSQSVAEGTQVDEVDLSDSDGTDSDDEDGRVCVPAVEMQLTDDQYEMIQRNFSMDPSLYKSLHEMKAVYTSLKMFVQNMLEGH